MLNNINLEYYKIFYEVAKTQNITEASKKLLISQPAVTQTIHKLEESLGVQLFIRQSRGLILTEIGEQILKEVSESLFGFQKIEALVQNETSLERGTITIGSGTTLARTLLVEPITEFFKIYPNIKIEIVDRASKKLLNELSLGQIDLVIAQKQKNAQESLSYHKLLDESYVFVCHKDYIEEDTLKNLKNKQLILSGTGSSTRFVFDELNEKQDWGFSPGVEVSGYNMSLELIKNKVGFGFLPYYFVEPFLEKGLLKQLKFYEVDIKTQYGYYMNKKMDKKALSVFLNFLNQREK